MAVEAFETELRAAMGLNAASIGSQAVERAVQERQLACGMADAEAYLGHLRGSATEMQLLIEAVVVPETWFFRDREAFAALTRLAGGKSGDAPRLVLSLPCSTGEEPYSMAMALLDAGLPAARFRIDAVDISARALAVAQRGIYGRNSFRGSELGFRDRHFTPEAGGMRVSDAVRAPVRFQQGNLFSIGVRPGAELYHAIFCRNLLIYFDRETQDQAVRLLRGMLMPEGMLFVGPSETGLMTSHAFTPAKLPMAFAFHRAVPRAAEPRVAPRRVTAPPPAPRRRAVPRPARPAPAPAPAVAVAVDIDTAAQLADQGRLAEAALLCESHRRQHGNSAQSFYLLGLIRDAEGELAQAAVYYRKALYLDRRHPDALTHLALLLERQGDLAGSRALRERARRGAVEVAP